MGSINTQSPRAECFEIEDATRAIIGNSAALQRVLGLVRVVAPTEATVLIQGETGTGKELIAEAIHKCSDKSSGPFVKVNWPPFLPACWKVSCSVTNVAPSLERSHAPLAALSGPVGARYFWTRSVIFP